MLQPFHEESNEGDGLRFHDGQWSWKVARHRWYGQRQQIHGNFAEIHDSVGSEPVK